MTETILTLLAIGLPGLMAFFFHTRAERLEAQNNYLRKTAERQRKLAEKKETLRAEVAKAEEVAKEEVAASATAAAEETKRVTTDTVKHGAAHAAMEHLKRLKVLLVAAALIGAPLKARAEPCSDGHTLMAGKTLTCDAECLPAEAVILLTARSIKLSQLERDCTTQAELARKREDVLKQEVILEREAREAAEAAAVGDAGWSTSTTVLVIATAFLAGAAAGAYAYHSLNK